MTIENFVEANAFAFKAHDGQLRNGVLKLPYITHPLEVANILAANGFADDYNVLAAALLHDVLEDTDVTPEELDEKFGATVFDLVLQVTYPAGTTKAMKVLRARGLTRRAAAIKTADLISNINGITEDPTAMTQENAYRYVNYAQAFKKRINFVNPGLDKAFDDALLNFNLNYLPKEI